MIKQMKRSGERTLLTLFLLSGACGLIYQVVWSRIFTNLFGSTVYAVGTVLAAFMSGLALGSYLLGRWADKRYSPVSMYALVEVGIGVSALISMFVLDNLGPLHGWLYAVLGSSSPLLTALRFVSALFAVLLPTVLMGATLPILSKALIFQHKTAGGKLGGLYAVNTFGAVCGSVAAGFFLIRWIGIHPTVYVAAGLNAVIGLTAWLIRPASGSFKYNESASSLPAAETSPSEQSPPPYLLFFFALSGFVSFGYEILWSRSLVVIFGNSTYAFSTMLIAMLFGISLGGFLVRLFIDKVQKPVRLFGWVQLGIGIAAGAAMPLLLSFLYSRPVQLFFEDARGRWLATVVARFGAAFTVMLVPAVLIGATFPIIGKIYLRNLRTTGREIGRIYAINTVGNITGSIIPAFVLIPLLGINKSIALLALLNCSMGIFIALSTGKKLRVLRIIPVVGYAALTVLLVLVPLRYQFPADTQSPGDRILYYEEGIMATTKVYLKPASGQKHMSVDGIYIGGSGGTEKKEFLLAHLPKLLLDRFSTELSVGLGSGILIGESVLHENIITAECIEISPTVIRGATYFERENHTVLANQKVNIIEADVISHLQASDERFDIVSTDAKSRPRSRGNGLFFSREYYELLKEHLSPGGLAIQWVPIHMPNSVYSTVIRTFTEVFPHVSLWYFPDVDSVLVGSLEEIEINVGYIEQMFSEPSGALAGLRNHRLSDSETLLANYVASQKQLREVTKGARINTLEHPIVEFYGFSEYSQSLNQMIVENLDFIMELKNAEEGELLSKQISNATRSGFESVRRAEQFYLQGIREAYALSEDREELDSFFDRALSEAPWNDYIRHQVHQYYLLRVKKRIQVGDYGNAALFVRQALQVDATSYEAHYLNGIILAASGEVAGGDPIREYRRQIGAGERCGADGVLLHPGSGRSPQRGH